MNKDLNLSSSISFFSALLNLVRRNFSYELYYFYSAFICSVINIKATNNIQIQDLDCDPA
jgi:hypothetical protein